MTSLAKTQGGAGLALHEGVGQMPATRTPFTDAMTPRTREEAWNWCQLVAGENWVPGCFKRQPMLVAIAVSYGERFGMDPMSCLQNIAVINGKPCMYGDMMLAIVRKDPDFEAYKEEFCDKPLGCTVTVKRKGQDPIVETFDETKARRAGLWGNKGPWTNYPDRMCMWRARGFALRTAFGDRLAGIISREEALDYPTVDHRGQPAPAVTGPVQDAQPEAPVELGEEALQGVREAENVLGTATTWAQFIEGEAKLKALALPAGPQRESCKRLYMEAKERLVAGHRDAFKSCESRAEWLKVSKDYSQAPDSVKADMLPEYNAAEARVQRIEEQEDATWQDDPPAQQQEPDDDDVPY